MVSTISAPKKVAIQPSLKAARGVFFSLAFGTAAWAAVAALFLILRELL